MQKPGEKPYYLLALLFWFIAAFFLGTGLWGVGSAFMTGAPVIDECIALGFLALFAGVSIIYGFYIHRDLKSGPSRQKSQAIWIRLRPVKVLSLLAFGLAPLLLVCVNAEMRTFNRERTTAFKEIRPAFLKYVADRGTAPRSLDRLVPQYIKEIPEVLKPRKKTFSVKNVQYAAKKDTARFYFKNTWRPGAGEYYDIVNDRYLNN